MLKAKFCVGVPCNRFKKRSFSVPKMRSPAKVRTVTKKCPLTATATDRQPTLSWALANNLPIIAEAQGDMEHAAWLLRRQAEDRNRSLLRRLEHLVDDARNERLESATALLQEIAAELRSALARDQIAARYEGTND